MIGFVFGKYLPFHNGHKALIEFALSKCTVIYVVVCASNQEKIEVAIRVKWIADTFANRTNLKIIPLKYNEDNLPNTSETSLEVSKIWSLKFLEIVPKVDLLISSENYGEYVAQFMNIQHLSFDIQRKRVPISASAIRNSIVKNWDFLPSSVKQTFQKKIVFAGTESTGKTSISKKMSSVFSNSSLVEEVGRAIINNSNSFSQQQLYEIAYRHAENIEHAMGQLKPFVFIDTNIYTTQSYSKYFFNKYLSLENSIYEINKADLTLYLSKDLEFIQDGTRLNKTERDLLDTSHQNTLTHFGIDYLLCSGDRENRTKKIEKEIRNIFKI